MEISETSTARASHDSLHFDVDEKELHTSAHPNPDRSTENIAPELIPISTPAKFLAESAARLGHHVGNTSFVPNIHHFSADRASCHEQKSVLSEKASNSTLLSEFNASKYNIESIAARDDIDLLKPWKRYLYFLSSFLAVAAFLTYMLYFAARIRFTLAAQIANHTVYPAAWIFVIVEMGVATPVLFHSLWSVFVLKSRGRQKLRLKGNFVPTVDVLVTCCGEDDDLILNTARAACNIDYPADRFRVIVCDDGKSPSLFRSIAALNDRYPNLLYRSRDKRPGLPHHFKAGNLNFGIEQTLSAKGKPGEFIAALDADMIPQREWLRAMLPHMLLDERCGLACPPQVCFSYQSQR